MKVGDIVFICKSGTNGLKRARVTKVGTKYFYTDHISWERYKLANLTVDKGNPVHCERCYLSLEDYYNDRLNSYIKNKVRKAFSLDSKIRPTDEQYRQVFEILGLKKPSIEELGAVTVD